MNLFIWYPRCSTCQKAKKFLDDNDIQYKLRDIVLETPTYEELSKWIKLSGLDIKKFFNTSVRKILTRSTNIEYQSQPYGIFHRVFARVVVPRVFLFFLNFLIYK